MIVNGTSHEILIFAENDCIAVQGGRKFILKKRSKPIFAVPSGKNLNAVKSNKPSPDLRLEFPVVGAVCFIDADPIPEGKVVVVSNLYRSACVELGRDTSTLATVDGVVYASEEDMKPVGCLRLALG